MVGLVGSLDRGFGQLRGLFEAHGLAGIGGDQVGGIDADSLGGDRSQRFAASKAA